jgi:pyruvate,water dikinase
MASFIKYFNDLTMNDLPQVGGKNASLGEMFQNLLPLGIHVPDGFATTSEAYWQFIEENQLRAPLTELLDQLDRKEFSNLEEIGKQIRTTFLDAKLPFEVQQAIRQGYTYLTNQFGEDISLAVRSSATAEDLPHASFAGQLESYLNVRGINDLLNACHKCYASLFTNRAIKYREDNRFEHTQVALSVGVQLMVRSDLGCSGVNFTLDPDSGFDEVVLITSVWGLGENIVQGTVNPDEFYVFKPTLKQDKQAIISRHLGSKEQTMVYAPQGTGIVNQPTPANRRDQYTLTDEEITTLAKWSVTIEEHYQRPMDIEWAKDGKSGQLYIVQARPETVHSAKKDLVEIKEYQLLGAGKALCQGYGLGNKITAGKARILRSPDEASKLQQGEVLVTTRTTPDWDPILKKASGIITDQGGRTSHAAIVAREVGAVAVIGAGNATEVIRDGQEVTVSCAEGETGFVYEGTLEWKESVIQLPDLPLPQTQVMLILGDPEQAFRLAAYPNHGVGLMRLEFIINNAIQIHPMALCQFEKVTDAAARKKIEQLTQHYPNKADYFVEKLAEAVARIAAAFYPKDVIVRMSDFKSNEYANLIGGHDFEPKEENPMLGFRGASRYYHPRYQPGFELECRAMKRVREAMGLENVKLMIPFCRSVHEAEKVLALMEQCGLKRGVNGLELYMMTEIPSNVVMAREFAEHFDGFSIGSNDLTQLVLGVDRDSDLLSDLFSASDPAVKKMIQEVITVANQTNTKIGLCGQAPSDDPAFAQFLVDAGINSISFNPDALVAGINNMLQAEKPSDTKPVLDTLR